MTRPLFTAALMLCCTALPATAQAPLDDGAPADAVVYVRWAGTDAVADGYADSVAKRVVDLMEPADVAVAWERWRALTEQRVDDADFSEGLDVALGLWDAGWHGPFSAWLAIGDLSGLPDGETDDALYGAVTWRPADPAARADLVARLTRLLREVPQAPVLLESEDIPDEPVRLLIGSGTRIAEMTTLAGGPRLADDPAYAGALAAAGDGPLAAYVNAAALTAAGRALLAQQPDVPAEVGRVLDVLHFEGLRRVAITAGYDGPGWRTGVFVDAPAPRRGVAALLDAPPITDADLAAVPADAPVVGAWAFDPAALLDLIRAAVAAADPQAAAQVDDALAQAGEMIGADLEADLIRGLGTAHVVFQDPAIVGDSGLGVMVVNRLRDAPRFDHALRGVQSLVNGLIAAQTADAPVTVQIHTRERDGVTLHTAALPGVAPTWAVFDGRLHIGLYPQSILAAADRRGGDTPSILDHPGFAVVRDAAGDHPVTGVSFVDVPATAAAGYGTLLMAEHVGTGLGTMALREPFPAVLPPFARLRPLLAPVSAVSWSDDAGYHSEGTSPFPGASLLTGGGSGGAALQVLPMLWGGVAGYIEQSRTDRGEDGMEADMHGWDDPDMAALLEIGGAVQRHADDHPGRPASASELLPYLDGGPETFRSVFSEHFADLTADNVDDATDFILLPGPPPGREADPLVTPIALRNPALLPVEAWSPLPVLYADGHVYAVESLDEVAAQYEAATGLTLDAVLGVAAE